MEVITAPFKYVQIAEYLRDEIMSGKLAPGSRLAPVRDLTARFSVSKEVISLAFDVLERERLICRKDRSGTFVAPGAGPSMSNTIILVLPSTEDKHNRLPIVLSSVLQRHGYKPYLFDSKWLSGKEVTANLKGLLAERPRAFVAAPYKDFDFKLLDWVEPATQLVLVRYIEAGKDIDAACVLEDYVECGRLACEHLLSLGRRKIAVVSYERRPGWSSDLMLLGVERALSARELEVFKYLDADAPRFVEEFGAGGCPDGVFCVADYYYSLVKKAAERHGLALGEDFDAIGNGDTPWAEAYNISTMDPRDEELAKQVAEILESGRKTRVMIAPVPVLRRPERDRPLT